MSGNRIYKVDKNGIFHRIFIVFGIRVKFKGKNSVVIFHEPLPKFQRCKIKLGNNCKCVIQSSEYSIRNMQIIANGNNSECYIGKNFSVTSHLGIFISPEDSLKVNIGDNCMFGKNVLIRATDGHTIIDTKTGAIKNKGADINIGNHVWISENASVLRGVTIADNCVIGTKSVVTRNCMMPNSIYAGAPAKLVSTDINWDRECAKTYEQTLRPNPHPSSILP